jgi:hypothetical protein
LVVGPALLVVIVRSWAVGRAVGQIHYGRALGERLPAVARVFVRGVIDFRMVLMIIARTENVEDAVIAELDAVIARHAEKWMKLSKPKLRDRIDLWVAKFDPTGVRVPPAVDDNRCLDVDPGASAAMALVSGHVHAADGAALDRRLEAWAATVCEHDPRTKEQPAATASTPNAANAPNSSPKKNANAEPGWPPTTNRPPSGSGFA